MGGAQPQGGPGVGAGVLQPDPSPVPLACALLGGRRWWALGGGDGGWAGVGNSGTEWRLLAAGGFAEGTRLWQAWWMPTRLSGRGRGDLPFTRTPTPRRKAPSSRRPPTTLGPSFSLFFPQTSPSPLSHPFATSGSETRQLVCRPSRDSSPSPRVRVRGRDFFVRKGVLRTREGRSLPRPTVAHNRRRHNGAIQGRPDPRFLHRQVPAEAGLTLPLLSEEVAVKGRGLWPVVLGSEQG